MKASICQEKLKQLESFSKLVETIINSVTYVPSDILANTFKFYVTGTASSIQIIESSGGTRTYTRDNAKVLGIEAADNGEIWTVATSIPEGTHTARAKFNGKWQTAEPCAFTVELIKADSAVKSCEVADSYEGTVYAGSHEITIVTGVLATKVQLVDLSTGSTKTYTADNASVEVDGNQKIWKFSKSFSSVGDKSFAIKTRTATEGFVESDVVLNISVVY